jgi:hypothetical protein
LWWGGESQQSKQRLRLQLLRCKERILKQMHARSPLLLQTGGPNISVCSTTRGGLAVGHNESRRPC